MERFESSLRERLDRLAGATDSLLVTGRANVRYLTGFTGTNGWAVWHRQALTLLTDPRYGVQARGECPTCDVRVCDGSLAAGLEGLIEDRALGFEPSHLSVSALAQLRQACPAATFHEQDGHVQRLRVRKTADEVEAIRAALRVAEDAGKHITDAVLVGRSESEVAADLDHACRMRGASEMSFNTIVAAGVGASRPHARPGAAIVTNGQIVQLDWGCHVNGYCSDISRAIAIGRPSDRWMRVHAAVAGALEEACGAMRPGRPVAEVDAVARASLSRHDLARFFVHGLGHGVGLEVHEAPRLSARSAEVLEVGMVVTVEPGVYIEGEGGIRLENLVVVRDGGVETLNTLPLQWMGTGAASC